MESLYKLRAEQNDKAFKLWREKNAQRRRCDELWKKGNTAEAMKCEELFKQMDAIVEKAYDDWYETNQKIR